MPRKIDIKILYKLVFTPNSVFTIVFARYIQLVYRECIEYARYSVLYTNWLYTK